MRINRMLVDSVINEVRKVTGEENTGGSVSDELILMLLNRSQDEAAQLLARHYVEPILTYIDVPLLTNEQDYELPEDCFEERVLKVEFMYNTNAAPYKMDRVDFDSDEASSYSSSSTGQIPELWMQIGSIRSIRVFPVPSGGGNLRMWYAKKPADLVKTQGRIKSVVNATTVELAEFGEEITANQDEDGSHLCIVDGQTGAIKAVLEVASVSESTNTVQFWTPTELNLTPITEQIEGIDIEACPDLTARNYVGDYLCLAPYTCIPTIRNPILNYIKQYAIALVQTNLGAEHEVAYKALKDMEKFVQSMDTGKQTHRRVKMKSDAYGGNFVRYNYPRPRD